MQRPKEKRQTMIYKTLHRKLKIEQHEPSKSRGWAQVHWKGHQYLLHMWHPLCYC